VVLSLPVLFLLSLLSKKKGAGIKARRIGEYASTDRNTAAGGIKPPFFVRQGDLPVESRIILAGRKHRATVDTIIIFQLRFPRSLLESAWYTAIYSHLWFSRYSKKKKKREKGNVGGNIKELALAAIPKMSASMKHVCPAIEQIILHTHVSPGNIGYRDCQFANSGYTLNRSKSDGRTLR